MEDVLAGFDVDFGFSDHFVAFLREFNVSFCVFIKLVHAVFTEELLRILGVESIHSDLVSMVDAFGLEGEVGGGFGLVGGFVVVFLGL